MPIQHVQTLFLVRKSNIPKLGHGVEVRACILLCSYIGAYDRPRERKLTAQCFTTELPNPRK